MSRGSWALVASILALAVFGALYPLAPDLQAGLARTAGIGRQALAADLPMMRLMLSASIAIGVFFGATVGIAAMLAGYEVRAALDEVTHWRRMVERDQFVSAELVAATLGERVDPVFARRYADGLVDAETLSPVDVPRRPLVAARPASDLLRTTDIVYRPLFLDRLGWITPVLAALALGAFALGGGQVALADGGHDLDWTLAARAGVWAAVLPALVAWVTWLAGFLILGARERQLAALGIALDELFRPVPLAVIAGRFGALGRAASESGAQAAERALALLDDARARLDGQIARIEAAAAAPPPVPVGAPAGLAAEDVARIQGAAEAAEAARAAIATLTERVADLAARVEAPPAGPAPAAELAAALDRVTRLDGRLGALGEAIERLGQATAVPAGRFDALDDGLARIEARFAQVPPPPDPAPALAALAERLDRPVEIPGLAGALDAIEHRLAAVANRLDDAIATPAPTVGSPDVEALTAELKALRDRLDAATGSTGGGPAIRTFLGAVGDLRTALHAALAEVEAEAGRLEAVPRPAPATPPATARGPAPGPVRDSAVVRLRALKAALDDGTSTAP